MKEILKSEIEFLSYRYPVSKLLASPSMASGPASLWAVIYMDQMIKELKQIRKLLESKEDGTPTEKAETPIRRKIREE